MICVANQQLFARELGFGHRESSVLETKFCEQTIVFSDFQIFGFLVLI